jgi:hypothetical protein
MNRVKGQIHPEPLVDGLRLAGFPNDRLWQIELKKSFLGDERNFLGPLMRFARDDVRDHIVLHKNSHRPSYQR